MTPLFMLSLVVVGSQRYVGQLWANTRGTSATFYSGRGGRAIDSARGLICAMRRSAFSTNLLGETYRELIAQFLERPETFRQKGAALP
jgi:hypothetical protein